MVVMAKPKSPSPYVYISIYKRGNGFKLLILLIFRPLVSGFE